MSFLPIVCPHKEISYAFKSVFFGFSSILIISGCHSGQGTVRIGELQRRVEFEISQFFK